MRRLVLVGQAPARTSSAIAFGGDSGARLARLLGMSLADLLRAVDTTNLLPRWPGRSASGKGDSFPLAEARRAAAELAAKEDPSRAFLLAGTNVARAFGVSRLGFLRWGLLGGRRVAVIPHPSGVSRWWNDARNRARARAFLLREIGGRG